MYTLTQQTSDVSRQLPFKMGTTDQVSKTKGSIENGPTMDGIVSYREKPVCWLRTGMDFISQQDKDQQRLELEGHHKRRLSPILRNSRADVTEGRQLRHGTWPFLS